MSDTHAEYDAFVAASPQGTIFCRSWWLDAAAGEGRWRATGRVGSGWLSTQVQVDLEVVDVEPDRALRITGRGGASGTSFEGWVAYVLRPGAVVGPTVVDWEVDVELKGGFAGPLARIIEQRGPEELDRLIACLKAQSEA